VPNPDTQHLRIIRGEANEMGWRNLEMEIGEEIAGHPPTASARSLLSLVHISDLHICDAQSPARIELLDRFADPHHPMSALVKLVGVYRAQEILTAQTLESMVQTINSIENGPITARPIDAVVVTGDVTDNAQSNELSWYLTLMDGGQIHPDSGNSTAWEGVASTDPEKYDRSYWNPEGTPPGCEDDFPRAYYGFPEIKGLTDAVRKPFVATGLRHQWLATHGNHDALLQGTVPSDEVLEAIATGDRRAIGLSPDIDINQLFQSFTQVGPANYPSAENAAFISTSADSRRTFNKQSDWAKVHYECGHGHGLTPTNVAEGTKYWFKDIGEIRLISLDTVNINGGWQGSLDQTQFDWLKKTLADPTPRYFVLLSHHPSSTLFNLYAQEGADRRIGEIELLDLLHKEPRVILWLAGHNHEHKIEFLEKQGQSGKSGFWHIQTASNIDWPQQGRTVEIVQDGNHVVIATTVFDHQSPIRLDEAIADLENPISMAGISRILSANHWQRRSGEFDLELGAGKIEDRNRFLWL
jgi:metallophosphoesterase (TIGR03767 family)